MKNYRLEAFFTLGTATLPISPIVSTPTATVKRQVKTGRCTTSPGHDPTNVLGKSEDLMSDHTPNAGDQSKPDPIVDLEARLAEIEAGLLDPFLFTSATLIQTTFPHSSRAGKELVLVNGNRKVTMWCRHGLPHGTYPRLLLCWLTREALRRKELPIDEARIIPLSGSFNAFLREVGIKSISGGKTGNVLAVKSQMRKLFSTHIGVDFLDIKSGNGFKTDEPNPFEGSHVWWDAQPDDQTEFHGHITLSKEFYKDLIGHAVPLDARVVREIRRSPMALDIYSWLTYRVSYLRTITVITWSQMRAQIGAGYPDTPRGIRNFRARFLDALEKVLQAWPTKTISVTANGIMLRPGPPSVSRRVDEAMRIQSARDSDEAAPF